MRGKKLHAIGLVKAFELVKKNKAMLIIRNPVKKGEKAIEFHRMNRKKL